MATDEGSFMNSDFASEEWELYEASGLSESKGLPIEPRALIEVPLDCIPSITNPNSETQIVNTIETTMTECHPGLESPTCISLPELPKLRNPKPALDEPINRPLGSVSSTESSSFLLDHTYSAQPSKKPPSKKSPMCELCRTFYSNPLLLTEHYKWHLFEDANVGVQKPSIPCLLEQSTESTKQTSEVDSQLHTMANVPKETSISPSVKPSILCLQKVRKAAQDTDGVLQSSKKNVLDQLQQTQSTENIKQTSEKTDSQLHTTANVFDETACLLKQPTESIRKTTKGTSQSLLSCDLLGPDKKHPVKLVYHTSMNKIALRDADKTYMLFRCNWCKKFFSQFESFKQHTCKRKSGKASPCALINAYLCEYCGLSFARHGNFMKHIVLQASNELHQTQSIVNIKQTSKNTDSRPHAKESVLQEPDVNRKQSALSLLKQSKEIIKQTSVKGDSQGHQQQRLFTLSRPDYVPEDKMALKNNNTSCTIGKHPQCSWCKKYFGRQVWFEQHMCKMNSLSGNSNSRTHKHMCEYCGYFVKLPDNYTKHSALHRCMQLEGCSPVLDSAATSDAILETSSSCNRTTPFQCSTCSRAFAFESQLLQHENLHRRHSYLCEYCGLFIKLSNNYTKRLALHRCMQLDGCSPVLDSAATSDAIPETSSSCIRTTPFQCSTCSKAFAFERQLLRHKNLHRLESRRPVPKRERSDSESGDEGFRKVQSGKKDSRGEERFGWKFRIKEPDGETGSGTRKRGTAGKGNQQDRPKSAPRWGGKAHAKGIKVKHFQCSTCSKAFAFESQLLRHEKLHRLKSRRPVPKRERSDSESGDESFGEVQSGKKGCGGEERFGWKFRIKNLMVKQAVVPGKEELVGKEICKRVPNHHLDGAGRLV